MFRWTVHLNGPPTERRRGSYSSYEYFHYFVAPVGQELYAFHAPLDDCDDMYVYSQARRRWIASMCVSVFNTVSLRWRELCPPATPTAEGPPDPDIRKPVVVPIEETIYVWGGYFGFDRNHDLYTFHVRTHRWLRPRVSGEGPIPSKGGSACAVPGSKVIYIVSGIEDNFYKLDTASMAWSWIDTTDSAMPSRTSFWHSATIVGTRMFVMEGETDTPDEQVVRVFDLNTERWLGRSRQPSDTWIQQACFSYGGEVYVLCHKLYAAAGGLRSRLGWPPPLEPYFGELLKLDMQDLSWKKVQLGGQAPGYSEIWCSCILGGCVVLFGRRLHNQRPNLFILDLSPSLKTLCKVAVIQWGLQQRSEFPHNVKWELAAMTQQEYGNIPSQQEHENKLNTTARA